MRKALLLALPVALAGCQTWGPTWSEVTGYRYDRISPAGLNVAPVAIQNIDGSGAFPNSPGQPVKVEPGKRRIVVQAAPLSAGWTGGTDLVVLNLDVAPCVRYYINAKYSNPLGASYEAFIGYEEKIAGCQVPART